MLSFSPATRIFVALAPVDMRAGFNRLYALVETRLHQPPLSGHLFGLTNRLPDASAYVGQIVRL